MSGATTRLEVDRAIAAAPSAIFDILRSPDGHVAIDASGMLMSAEGDPAAAVANEQEPVWTGELESIQTGLA